MIPLGDRVLLQRAEGGDRQGRIIIPSKYRQAPQEGTVLAVGANTHVVKVGDRVLFGRYAFLETQQGLIIREQDILAVLDDIE